MTLREWTVYDGLRSAIENVYIDPERDYSCSVCDVIDGEHSKGCAVGEALDFIFKRGKEAS